MILFSIATAIFYIVGFLILYIARPKIMAGYLLLFTHQVYNLISLGLIESGEWIVEAGRYGYSNGSLLIYIILLLFTLIGYLLAPLFFPRMEITKIASRKWNGNDRNKDLRSVILIILIYLALFGFAYFRATGVDDLHRHNFLQFTYPKWLIFIMVNTYVALGWYLLIRITGFMPRVFVFLLFSSGGILYGGSFTTIINNAELLIIGQSLNSSEKRSAAKVYFFLIFAFVVAVIAKGGQELLAKNYEPEQLDLIFSFFSSRLTTQAYLIWFSVESYFSGSLVDVGSFEFLLDFFNPTHVLTTKYGLGRLMFHANNEFGQDMVDRGIGMSAGFPSIVLASLGLVPTILTCISMGFVFYIMFSLMINFAKNYAFPMFLLAFYFFNQFSNIIFNGDYGFINFKTIVYLGAALVIFAFGKRYMYGRVWPKVRA